MRRRKQECAQRVEEMGRGEDSFRDKKGSPPPPFFFDHRSRKEATKGGRRGQPENRRRRGRRRHPCSPQLPSWEAQRVPLLLSGALRHTAGCCRVRQGGRPAMPSLAKAAWASSGLFNGASLPAPHLRPRCFQGPRHERPASPVRSQG